MDYTNLLNYNEKVKLGIVGATQGFGYTTLVQVKDVEQIDLRAISSIDTEESYNVLLEIGYQKEKIVICNSVEEIKNVDENKIIVVGDYKLILEAGITAVVETTGNIDIGTFIAENALSRNINVYMVSKETDSFSGPYFNHLAYENGTIYTLINGDQPRNLIDLLSWGRLVGLDIVAAGKSSEYDFVWDRESGDITYTDGKGEYFNAKELFNFWEYKDKTTLDQRYKILSGLTGTIAADICEMNLVSNVTGLLPATPSLNYPIAKVKELADIFVPKKDGGILENPGVVDVFYQLREKQEPSFAGGVFLIFKIKNKKVIDLLRSKGHLISKNEKYGCIYEPYHMMGIEAPLSIILGDSLGLGTRKDTRQVSVMVGVAEVDIKGGHTFRVYGHHHEIENVTPRLFEIKQASNAVPFYLLNDIKLKKDIKKGHIISLDDIDTTLVDNEAFKNYQKGLELD